MGAAALSANGGGALEVVPGYTPEADEGGGEVLEVGREMLRVRGGAALNGTPPYILCCLSSRSRSFPFPFA